MKYQPVIGLEVHIELKTASKMFCGCKNDPFFAPKPNIYTCPVCLGLPGALPVPNQKAVEWCIRLGLALNCTIPKESKFDRKNYFYPDLPKGYQISQYDKPLCENGWIEIQGRKIRIRRVHQEEDTGKLQHVSIDGKHITLVDFNRSGVPLVEIVSEPDFHTIDEVDQYVKKLQRIIRYLDVSNADMEKGSMRLEPSISLRLTSTEDVPSYRVELKNINSFRFVRRAIEYEITRQTEIFEAGKVPMQQTRGWSENEHKTLPQRGKEEAHDYRYFPEPDIPPLRFTNAEVKSIKDQLPELPDQKQKRFAVYGVTDADIDVLIETQERADFFETSVTLSKSEKQYKDITPKMIANALINRKIDVTTISASNFLEGLVTMQAQKAVSREMLEQAVEQILNEQSKAISDYKQGKTAVLMFLVGQVKKKLEGKGDAEEIRRYLEKLIVNSS